MIKVIKILTLNHQIRKNNQLDLTKNIKCINTFKITMIKHIMTMRCALTKILFIQKFGESYLTKHLTLYSSLLPTFKLLTVNH